MLINNDYGSPLLFNVAGNQHRSLDDIGRYVADASSLTATNVCNNEK